MFFSGERERVCVCVCVDRGHLPPHLHLGVCVHRVSVLRGSGANTEWSHTGNKLSDETLRNYWETLKERERVCECVCVRWGHHYFHSYQYIPRSLPGTSESLNETERKKPMRRVGGEATSKAPKEDGRLIFTPSKRENWEKQERRVRARNHVTAHQSASSCGMCGTLRVYSGLLTASSIAAKPRSPTQPCWGRAGCAHRNGYQANELQQNINTNR